MEGFNGIPILYDYRNVLVTRQRPNTVHSKNTALAWYFKRYLLEKVISNFKFEDIPENWAKNYFQYVLFVIGHIAVINTDKFGIIPQHCTLAGRTVQYQPAEVIIANPLINRQLRPKIGIQCSLIQMQPDYGGCWDLIEYYADMMAISSESAAVNLFNSKLAFIFATSSKSGAETFKKAFDEIASGNPAAVVDKELFNEDGSPNWLMFNQHLRETYIAGDILEDLAKWDARFNTEIGIPNVNIAKQSGVSDAEVAANNVDTYSKFDLWLETIQEGLDQTNRMFGTNISVRPRFGRQEGEQTENGNVIDLSTVQLSS